MSLPRYETVYGVHLLDDLHNFFPAILYHPSRFITVTDLLTYVQVQMNSQFNLYNRGARQYMQAHGLDGQRGYTTAAPSLPTRLATPSYTRQTTAPQPPVVMETETIDITHLFGGGPTTLDALLGLAAPPPPRNDTSLLTSILQAMRGGGNRDPFAPVVVAPTAEQVSRASSLRSAVVADEQNTCSICQESYTEGQAIRHITHCGHEFHINCITPWFESHVQCPVCRFDIRDHGQQPTEQ